jgi:large repetitive protein
MRLLLLLLFSLVALSTQLVANVTIATPTLPNGTSGTSYSATITAKNGCTPYVWTISGALPAGVISTVNKTSLSLTGTPTKAAAYSFSVLVKGCGGKTSQVSYAVVIQAAAVHVVNMSWVASTSPDVAGYNMYRAPDGVTWRKINSGGLIAWTLYSDSSGANHTTYYYAATSVNIFGTESSKSASVSVVVP